ncbi:MAG TPA: 4Fe-4S dicluster domain-containing protein [Thermoguttaceae bacterium]|nr:4Fe-4S dicluster domain-containing protein [Thermoguttaceae bacterium]
MAGNRRCFLKSVAGAGALTILGSREESRASGGQDRTEGVGVLVDCTWCVGCRSCEKACNAANTDLPRRPPEVFEDESVFEQKRRMDHGAYTVVNRHQDPDEPGKSSYAKIQCMHCLYPACVSACIVGALTREPNGPVIYDSAKCIGCRYCMAACPFQVPAYEYSDTLTPEVRKCTFCFQTRLSQGEMPACVQSCPMQVMTFGKRTELIRLAREKLRKHPDRYVPHVYGETELGGTAWMYLSGMSFEKLGLPKFGYHPVPGFTEPIQHALFKWFLPPLALYGTLGGIMWFLKSREKRAKAESGEESTHER